MRLSDDQIGAELHALRQTPSETFAAELDAWAAEGFPAKQAQREGAAATGKPPWSARSLPWRRLAPALAVFAVSVAVIGVVASTQRDGTGQPQGVDLAAPQSAQPSAGAGSAAAPAPRESIAPTTAQPLPPTPSEQLKPGHERVQERSASLALSTEPDRVDDVSDGVVDVTDRYDGIVASSQVSTAAGRGRATFDLRVPTQNLQAALADLSDLAHVSSRNEGTLDITAPFVSAQERFDDAKAAVDSLLDQLADASSPAETAAIREQLRLARQELAAARSELGGLKRRADFSRLDVTVTGDGSGNGSWSIGDAADDALGVLEAIGGAALIALAVLVPIGGLAALGWAGSRELRRRRREAALDR